MCYARVPKERLAIDAEQCLLFLDRFASSCEGDFEIYWCGTGEVFIHGDFPEMINVLNERHGPRARHVIMTNGMIDRLGEIRGLEAVKLRVSLDWPRELHEWNRGSGTYDRALSFCRRALSLNCAALDVKTLATKDNVHRLQDLEDELKQMVGDRATLSLTIPFTSSDLTRIASPYMADAVDESRLMRSDEVERLLRGRYGPEFDQRVPEAHCRITEISLKPWGVYTCCEGMFRIGGIDSGMDDLRQALARETPKCYQCLLRPGQFEAEERP